MRQKVDAFRHDRNLFYGRCTTTKLLESQENRWMSLESFVEVWPPASPFFLIGN